MKVLKESFNAGEFTPKLYSRYELAKYKNGCKTLANFVPMAHGPVSRRPGTEYIAEIKTSSAPARLIPFEFSRTDSYIIEAGSSHLRFYRNQGQVQSGDANTKLLLHLDGPDGSTTITDEGATVHTVTTVTNASLSDLQPKFGTSYCHFGVAGSALTVPDHADWTFGSGAFTIDFWVKFSSFTHGDAGFFEQKEDADNRYELYYDESAEILYFKVITSGTTEVTLSYSWTPLTGNIKWYHIAIIRGWGGSANSWAMCINGTAVDTDTVNYTIPDYGGADGKFYIGTTTAGTLMGGIDEFRVSNTARWTANFSVPSAQYPFGDDTGTVYELAHPYDTEDLFNLYYTQSADTMYITHENYVVKTLIRSSHVSWAIASVSFTNAPVVWGASDYPRTVEFYEDRFVLGGSPSYPDSLWFTDVGDYVTFTAGGADDAAITATLAARKVNDIQWISAERRLLVGTVGEEWWASGSSDTEPITATNKIAKRDSSIGSKRVMPVNIGDIVFFVDRSGSAVMESTYEYSRDKYIKKNLNVLAEHLTKTYKITSMAYQQRPNQILWCIRQDGALLSLTYLKDHDVVGWAKHTSGDGVFESVATIPGEIEDEVWFVVQRVVDGNDVRYIERLKEFNFGTSLEDAFFVDSGLTYDGPAATSISGLGHLEGEAVAVLADGLPVTGKTVSSGSITLSTAASKVHVGLAYTSELETLEAVVQDQDGTLQGIMKRITNVSLSLVESVGGLYGPDSSRTDDIPYDDETAPFTGWTRDLSYDEGFSEASTVYVGTSEPLPLTVAAISIDLED